MVNLEFIYLAFFMNIYIGISDREGNLLFEDS